MSKNYGKRKPIQYPGINTKKHPFVGIVWPVKSSRSPEPYSVEMTEKGFTCECIGFTMHGKCRHINYVGELLTAEVYPLFR